MINKINLLGVEITAESEKNILEEVSRLIKKGKKFIIVTPNPEILIYAKKHKPYQTILNHASVSLPDGVGLLWAARMLQKPLKTRITGVDFIEKLCKHTKEEPVSMGFLGGRTGVAEKAAECLVRRYPWVKVAFVGEEWPEAGFTAAQAQSDQVIKSSSHQVAEPSESIQHAREKSGSRSEKLAPSPYTLDPKGRTIDLLFVALGAPKQEEWIAENLPHLPVTAAMGVGGSFDYLSGDIVRAPGFIRALGLEWLFRLARQPWRWKRQLALVEFIWLVLKEKFGTTK